jgi:putative oxidoreductase
MKKYFTFAFFLKLVVAIILLQTLFFKFTGAAESKYIFETVGMEPWGRIGSGIVELIAAILILMPRSSWIGAILALGTVSGAIFFHLTKLGIVVMDDGGLLFILACVVFVFSLIILWIERQNVPVLNRLFSKQGMGENVATK